MEQHSKITADKLAEHLSAEITSYTAYLATFRSRMAFAVLVGPFLLLGSFVVATKGVGVISVTKPVIVATSIACLCYVGLGIYGGMLDSYITGQCDLWRQQIVRLSRGEEIQEREVMFKHRSVPAYVLLIMLFLGAFLSIAYAIFVR